MKLFFVFLCLPAFALGCGSNPGDTKAPGSTKQADSSAQLGDRCGGFVANPRQCDTSANLYCKASRVPDMPGTCTSCDDYGALPRIAEVCADGNTYSAHWVASASGGCSVEVCPPGAVACVDTGACLVNQQWDATQCQCVATSCTPDGINLGDGCNAGAYCAADASGNGTCTPVGNTGDACGLAIDSSLVDQQCQSGLHCVVADPNGDPNVGACG
jgi:hypothetical protein